MTISNVKAMAAKVMMAGVVAGALSLAGAAKAQAQQFAVGVQFGGPHYQSFGGYRAPGYGAPGFYARRDWEREEFARRQAFIRQQEFVRHEEWDRAHRFGPPMGYGYYGR